MKEVFIQTKANSIELSVACKNTTFLEKSIIVYLNFCYLLTTLFYWHYWNHC